MVELIYDWKETLDTGNKAEDIIAKFYRCIRGVNEVRDISRDNRYKDLGDLLILGQQEDGSLFQKTSEVKGDNYTYNTGNLFLETVSRRSQNKTDVPGWMITCRADYLDYYSMGDDTLYHFNNFPELKKWFAFERRNFKETETVGSTSVYGGPRFCSAGVLMKLDYLLPRFNKVNVYKGLQELIKEWKKNVT